MERLIPGEHFDAASLRHHQCFIERHVQRIPSPAAHAIGKNRISVRLSGASITSPISIF